MDAIMSFYNWVMANKQDLIDIVAYAVLAASLVIKLIPTLDKGNRWLPFVKFIGKYIALDKYPRPKDD